LLTACFAEYILWHLPFGLRIVEEKDEINLPALHISMQYNTRYDDFDINLTCGFAPDCVFCGWRVMLSKKTFQGITAKVEKIRVYE
jgi:hypothetical protein